MRLMQPRVKMSLTPLQILAWGCACLLKKTYRSEVLLGLSRLLVLLAGHGWLHRWPR